MPVKLTAPDVEALCDFVHDACGIALDETKSYLLENRLKPLVRQHGLKDYRQLVEKARVGFDRTVTRQIVDAITTRETLFFRDNSPFQMLRQHVLPQLIESRRGGGFDRRLRIWSAACSSGQEPVSIAITLKETIPDLDRWCVSILATDISDAAIQQAERAVYSASEAERGLDARVLQTYFRRGSEGWVVDESIRRLISYKRFNLHESFAAFGNFDIVFCRNVAIYFSPEGRASLFSRLGAALNPTGALFVGSSESLADMADEFTPTQVGGCVCYRKRAAIGVG